MELAEISNGQVGKRMTSQLGPLRLASIKGGKQGRKKVISESLEGLRAQLGQQSDRLFLVGGSWRAIARIDMQRRDYPLHVMHEYRMTPRDIRETSKYIKANNQDHLRKLAGVSSARMDLVPIAIDVLKGILRHFKPHDIAVSSYGIREGLLLRNICRKPCEIVIH